MAPRNYGTLQFSLFATWGRYSYLSPVELSVKGCPTNEEEGEELWSYIQGGPCESTP